MLALQVNRLSVVEKDGLFWVCDWVPETFGHSTINRFHFSFRNRRDADSFVKAAKRSIVA